jgi:hypothetical protein
MKTNLLLTILFGVSLFFCSITSYPLGANQTMSAIKLNFRSDKYGGIAWLSQSELVALTSEEGGNVLGYRKENDPTLYPLYLPEDLPCTKGNIYVYLGQLTDGRLSFKEQCRLSENFPNESSAYLVAYDLQTHEIRPLVKAPLPYYASYFSWNPEMTRGVMQMYQTLGGTIFWITPEEGAPMDVVVGDDKRSWSLATEYPKWADDDNQGIAAFPAWSPDGTPIAFFASTDAIGRPGLSAAYSEFKIYFMDPEEQKPRPVLDGIYHPMQLKWSPDGKWLAFIGKMGLPSKDGIWIFSPDESKTHFVAPGDYRDIVWSPDGSSLIAMLCPKKIEEDPFCKAAEFWKYDMSKLLE